MMNTLRQMIAGPPGEGREGQAAPQVDQETLTQIVAAFDIPGRPSTGGFGGPNFLSRLGIGGGGGGFGGGGQNLVDEGDYLVTMTVGDRTFRQVLRVEKSPTAP